MVVVATTVYGRHHVQAVVAATAVMLAFPEVCISWHFLHLWYLARFSRVRSFWPCLLASSIYKASKIIPLIIHLGSLRLILCSNTNIIEEIGAEVPKLSTSFLQNKSQMLR